MAKTEKVTITVDMVDELAQVRDQLRALQAREKHLKEQFRKAGAGIYAGESHQVEISFTEKSTLDMDAVREALGHEWCESHKKPVVAMNIREMELV